MQLTLVVPGPLDWPASVLASVDPYAPALSRLLAAGGSPVIEDDGLLSSACRSCAIAKQSDWPAAPKLARAAGIDPEDAYWLCAEPATLIVGRDDVRLSGLVDDLAASDAETLLAVLNAHFGGDGIRFFAPTPVHWFVRCEHAQRIATRPPEAAQDAPLFAFLPAGPDAPRWRRWQNELQMLLFEHAVNRKRDQERLAPINSVWLWGGGMDQKRQTPAPAIFADQGRVRDLARGSGVDVAPLPAGFGGLPDGDAAVWLAPIGAGDAPALLAAIDRAWMAPIEQTLNARLLSDVELVVGGRERALRVAVRRTSRARRWRARLSPPRFSRLLEELAPGLGAA
jgi:hypothetical protein